MFRISDFNSWRSEFLCFVIGFCVADAMYRVSTAITIWMWLGMMTWFRMVQLGWWSVILSRHFFAISPSGDKCMVLSWIVPNIRVLLMLHIVTKYTPEL